MSKNDVILASLRADSDESAYVQLRNAIGSCVLRGLVQPGQEISSIRTIAAKLNTTQSAIRKAFNQLTAEGWLESRQGSGTSIADHVTLLANQAQASFQVAESELQAPQPSALPVDSDTDYLGPFSRRSFQKFVVATASGADSLWMSEYLGRPIPEPCQGAKFERAVELWKSDLQKQVLALSEPSGLPELKERLAGWLNQTRGMNCSPANIIVMNSIEECRNFIARLFIDQGTPVLIENPSVIATQLQARDAILRPVAMDDSGIIPEELDEIKNVKLAYISTSCQMPTGAVLSRPRRRKIADWAAQHRALVIEDDTNCEFTYDSRLIPPIHAIDQYDRTVYIGSLGVLLPLQMQLAYAVVPSAVRGSFSRLKSISDRCTSPLVQKLVLRLFETEFIHERVKRLQRTLEERRSVLLHEIEKMNEQNVFTYSAAKSGIYQTVWLPVEIDDLELARNCAPENVLAISPAYLSAGGRPGLMLNFCGQPQNIQSYVRQLFDLISPLRHNT